MNVKGKTVLITGGARIGEAVALSFAERGANVGMTFNRSKRNIESTLEGVRQLGGEGLAIKADLGKESGIQKTLSAMDRHFRGFDILVNMVSVYEEIRIGKISRKSWESYMESELRTASRLALGASKRMKRRKDGRIILFSDWVAASGRPRYRNFLPYYVAKAAIVGLVESLALELAPGILVNAVAPGPILPPKKISPEEKRSVSRATPLARWGGAAEVAKAVLFLVETDFVTGECIRVDGGRHLL